MPIALDSLPTLDPSAVRLPGSVTVSSVMRSTGTANTRATIAYSIDAANDVFIEDGGASTKAVIRGPFAVPVAPGVVRDDILPLARGGGSPRALVPIALAVQECDAAGAPIGAAQHRNVVVQIL